MSLKPNGQVAFSLYAGLDGKVAGIIIIMRLVLRLLVCGMCCMDSRGAIREREVMLGEAT